MANETIKIFELDIDVDAAIESQSELKTMLDQSKASLDALKKSGDTSSQQYVELQAQVKSLSREYNAAQTQLGKMLNLQGKEIKTVQQGEAALTIINKEWSKQAQLYGANSDQADKLAKKHAELKERTRELRKDIGDTSTNIGNYSEGMKEALGSTTLFGRAQSLVNDVLNVATPIFKVIRSEISAMSSAYKAGIVEARTFSGAQKAAAVSTTVLNTALKLFKIALISTGIGAIIVLIGSLVAWFSKTQAGIDLVNKALAGLGAFFDVIIDRLSKFGGAVIKLISGDLKGFFNDAKDAASGFGDEIAREVQLAIKLEEVLQRVEKAEVNLDIRRSAANARLKELNLTIEDITKSEEERLKAAQEFARIESSLAAEEVSNQEQRVAAMLGFAEVTTEVRNIIKQIGQEGVSLDQLGLSESTIEDAKEFRDEISKLFDLQTRSFEVQTTNQNKLNTITEQVRRQQEAAAKEAQAQRQKAIDDAIKEQKVRLDLFIEQNEAESNSLQESLRINEVIRDQRLAILEEEVKAGKKTQTEAELERLKIKKAFLDDQKDLVLDFAEEELAIFKNANQSRIDANQVLNDAIVNQEVKRLEAIAEKEREYQEKRLAEGIISEIEYNEAIQTVNDEFRTAKAELETQLKEQKAQAAVIDLENERAVRQEQYDYDLGMQLADLERRKQQELKIAEQTGADKTLIEQKYAKEEDDIRETVAANKRQLASDTFGNLVTILGKESAAGKAAAVAQTTIDTYQAATAAYKALAGIPVVGPALGAVAAGAAVASGLANVKKIVSTKEPNLPKAEKGGLFAVGGKRHAAGGTKFYGEDGTAFEAEQGELITVLNRNAAIAMNGLNKIYPAGGGRSGNYFADGGIVQRAISNNTSPSVTLNSQQLTPEVIEQLAIRLSQANASLPRPITDVKDIINQVNNYNAVVNGANI